MFNSRKRSTENNINPKDKFKNIIERKLSIYSRNSEEEEKIEENESNNIVKKEKKDQEKLFKKDLKDMEDSENLKDFDDLEELENDLAEVSNDHFLRIGKYYYIINS
jgi:hypothetical protein